jgi:hypothetical protein
MVITIRVRAQHLVGSSWRLVEDGCDNHVRLEKDNAQPCEFADFLGLWIKVPSSLQDLIASFLPSQSLCYLQQTCRAFRRRFVVLKFIKRRRRVPSLLILRAVTMLRLKGSIFSETSFRVKAKKGGRFVLNLGRVCGGTLVGSSTKGPEPHLAEALDLCRHDLKHLKISRTCIGAIYKQFPKFKIPAALETLTFAGGLKNMRGAEDWRLRCLTLSHGAHKLALADVAKLVGLESLVIWRTAKAWWPDFAELKGLAHLRRIKYQIDGGDYVAPPRWCAGIASLPALREFESNVVYCDAEELAVHEWDSLVLHRPLNPLALRSAKAKKLCLYLSADKGGGTLSACISPSWLGANNISPISIRN